MGHAHPVRQPVRHERHRLSSGQARKHRRGDRDGRERPGRDRRQGCGIRDRLSGDSPVARGHVWTGVPARDRRTSHRRHLPDRDGCRSHAMGGVVGGARQHPVRDVGRRNPGSRESRRSSRPDAAEGYHCTSTTCRNGSACSSSWSWASPSRPSSSASTTPIGRRPRSWSQPAASSRWRRCGGSTSTSVERPANES
jgi:hypothetical protein